MIELRRTILRSLAALAAAAPLVVATWSCREYCAGQPAPIVVRPGAAFVRFIQASPDAAPTDFNVGGRTLVHDALFNTPDTNACCYRAAPVGSVALTALSGANAASALDSLRDSAYYTVVLLGRGVGRHLLVLRDTLNTPPTDSARVRIIHAVPDAQALDVSLAGKTLVHSLAFGSSSGYVTVHSLLPRPLGTDTGSFVVNRAGDPMPLFVIQSGHVAVPGTDVFTIVVCGEYSPNGVEPLATSTIYLDNVPSSHGLGDAVLTFDAAAFRLLNATQAASNDQLIFYQSVGMDEPPDWRDNFPGQAAVKNIPPDSISSYLPLGLNFFAKDGAGRTEIALRIIDEGWNKLTDSVMVDPVLKDHRFTVITLGGTTPPFRLVVLSDTTPSPPPGMTAVRFVNATRDTMQTAALAEATHGPIGTGVPVGGVSASATLDAGTASFTLTLPGGTASLQATLTAGETYTVVALGSTADNDLRLKLVTK